MEVLSDIDEEDHNVMYNRHVPTPEAATLKRPKSVEFSDQVHSIEYDSDPSEQSDYSEDFESTETVIAPRPPLRRGKRIDSETHLDITGPDGESVHSGYKMHVIGDTTTRRGRLVSTPRSVNSESVHSNYSDDFEPVSESGDARHRVPSASIDTNYSDDFEDLNDLNMYLMDASLDQGADQYVDDFEVDSTSIISGKYSNSFESSSIVSVLSTDRPRKSSLQYSDSFESYASTLDQGLHSDTADYGIHSSLSTSAIDTRRLLRSPGTVTSQSTDRTAWSRHSYTLSFETTSEEEDSTSISNSVHSVIQSSRKNRDFTSSRPEGHALTTAEQSQLSDFLKKKLLTLKENQRRQPEELTQPALAAKAPKKLDKEGRKYCKEKIQMLRNKLAVSTSQANKENVSENKRVIKMKDTRHPLQPTRQYEHVERYGIPTGKIEKLRIQNTMAKMKQVADAKIHKPSKCKQCRAQQTELQKANFLRVIKNRALNNMIRDKVDQIKSTQGISSTVGFLLDGLPGTGTNSEDIYRQLMEPLKQAGKHSDKDTTKNCLTADLNGHNNKNKTTDGKEQLSDVNPSRVPDQVLHGHTNSELSEDFWAQYLKPLEHLSGKSECQGVGSCWLCAMKSK